MLFSHSIFQFKSGNVSKWMFVLSRYREASIYTMISSTLWHGLVIYLHCIHCTHVLMNDHKRKRSKRNMQFVHICDSFNKSSKFVFITWNIAQDIRDYGYEYWLWYILFYCSASMRNAHWTLVLHSDIQNLTISLHCWIPNGNKEWNNTRWSTNIFIQTFNNTNCMV